MSDKFKDLPFRPADILIPRDCDLSRWSVVACDQYTSQPEYWQRVEERVGDSSSALNLILPESKLEQPDVAQRIKTIETTMDRYLEEGLFHTYENSLFYVERTLSGGKVRRGLIGALDLEAYDYTPGCAAPVRATEGTVLSRIPPRVEVRKNASIELPHVMVLADDPQRTVIEPLAAQTDAMEPVYDFELMEKGGHIKGWRLNEEQMNAVADALSALSEQESFRKRYDLKEDKAVILFAVGDGNHSLATAKACYELQKEQTAPEQWATLPARYALVELGNLHDESLEFEPIHRVVFGVDPEELLVGIVTLRPGGPVEQCHDLHYVYAESEGTLRVVGTTAHLPVGTLQAYLDKYLEEHPGAWVDYIHGEDVTRELATRPDAVGFLLPSMEKGDLFPTVIHDGVLPRKTFSMGEAHDKRFYLEARKIRT